MSDSVIEHRIAVRNFVYGEADFLTLRLPEVWDIAPGVGHPEVVAAHDRAGHKWVVSGKAWYVLYHRELGWAMELLLESRAKRKRQPAGSAEQTALHGHPADVRRWERKRGVFRPKLITYVEVMADCEKSDRTLRIELSGRCPGEGFDEVLRTISGWRCH